MLCLALREDNQTVRDYLMERFILKLSFRGVLKRLRRGREGEVFGRVGALPSFGSKKQ